MADASATFSIDLQDGTSGAAASAAGALQKLRSQIDGDTKALAAMQKAMRNLQGGTVVNIAQFKELKAKIDTKKQSIAQAQSSLISLGGSFTPSGKGAKGLAERFAELTKTSQGMPGPLGGVLSKLGGMQGVLAGGAIALGVIAIAAALTLLAAASVAAAVGLLKYGVAQADARRSELLRLEGLTKMRNWYGLAAGNAVEMQGAIDRVSGSVAIGRDKVSQYSDQLYRMGLRGENLSLALEGVAIKAAVQGDAAASAFAGWAAGAAMAGGSVRKLTDDVKARLGGIAAKQMLSLDVQSKKLHESFAALFSGLKIEGFLKSLNMVTALFSQNTASGRALKVIFEGLFQPVLNAVEYLGPVVKRFFQGMVIGALLLTIGLLTVRNWFKKTFGDSEILKGFDAQKAALYTGLFAVSMLTAGLGLLALAFGVLVAPILAVAGAFALIGIAIGEAIHWFMSVDWIGLGTSMATGIVTGIKNGATWVIDAVKNLADSAWGAFKSKLGIASPSKAFAKLGVALPQGIEAGIDTGTPALRRSVESLLDAPSVPPSEGPTPTSAAGGTAAAGRGPVSISFGDIVISATGDKPKEIAANIKREVERIFETIAAQLGAPVPGGG